MVTGEEFILLLFLCIGCRPVPTRTLGSTMSLPFRTGRITERCRWMFPFSSHVLVNVSTEISLPGERSSSQMLLSTQKLFGGLCLVGLSIGTVDIFSLRGSGSENTFSCGLPFGLGALSPLAKLGRQGQTLLEIT